MRRFAALATTCSIVSAAMVVGAAQAPAPGSAQSQPTFRAGVDIVTLDVVVLDKDRHPVRGLTQADFTVTESGDRQSVVSFNEVSVTPPDMAAAAWTREVAPDVVSNDFKGRRLVVILMDDASTGTDFGEGLSVRKVAHGIIDQLGPEDLGAVVYTYLGRYENFTADRGKLHAAVNSFVPRKRTDPVAVEMDMAVVPMGCALRMPGVRDTRTGTGCQVNGLARIGEVLRTAPPGRKLVAFVSPGIELSSDTLNDPSILNNLPFLSAMLQQLQLANASVYEFDPRGLLTGVRGASGADATLPAGSRGSGSFGVALGEATGGRLIQNTNAPERIVPAVFEENSSYYLLGYRSTHTRTDGTFRKVSVKVSRAGLTVISRSGYYGPTKASTKPSKKVVAPIDTALASGIPAMDLPLGVTVAPFAVPGRRDQEVVATLVVDDPMGVESGATTHKVDLVSVAYDTGWRSAGAHRQAISVTRNPGVDDPARYELTSRLSLKPGRYELRFAADSEGRTGSVYVSLDVPNFAKDPLSLSGLVLSSNTARRVPVGASLIDLLPVVPTTTRTFTARDQPSAFLRVYEGGTKPFVPIAMSATIKDSRDREVVTRTSTLEPRDFSTTRSADYHFALPISTLSPGEYLLTIEADMGSTCVERAVRFRVR